ncbi:polysaccharide deacetylase family protein, partial [Candidatus Saccharibacteria bacterium]|nr:polysaccharide deacetylase family protein [Candidatus Saccharibacteria bacterium]
QLRSQLVQIQSSYGQRKISFKNGKDSWTFSYKDLGVTFDEQSTIKAVEDLNHLSLLDKYRLLVGDISSAVEPRVLINTQTCEKTLATIIIADIAAQDAIVSFDQSIKLQTDKLGSKYIPASNCQKLAGWLGSDSSSVDIYLDPVAANLTQADLSPNLSKINDIISQSVTMKYGSYQKVLSPQDILALLTTSKDSAGVHIGWSSDRLSALTSEIAGRVNTNNPAPSLGMCQSLITAGGNWLDQNAVKTYLQGLTASGNRNYSLPVSYHAASIATRSRVAQGTKVIYLTFDDGMTYADSIMNYAACYGIKVTFFEIGSIAASQAVPLRRAIAEGHTVQSHGYIHAAYNYASGHDYAWQYNDINQSISAITAVTGVRPTYFRPPGGNHNSDTQAAATANGVRMILWDDASRDATVGGLSSATTCANVLAGAYPGASVLMHSTHYSTAEAVPCIVEGLAARGYTMDALR